MKPILFYTVGYPGAGKTTFAHSLATWLSAPHIRGDKIGLELFRFPTFSPQEKAMVYQEMAQRSADALRAGQHVLYDASVNTHAQREQLRALAATHGTTAVGLYIEVATLLAKQRAAKMRDAGLGQPVARIIPPHIFDQIIAGFEAPQSHEYTIRIPGDIAFPLQYTRLRNTLSRANMAVLPRLVSN